MTECNVQFIDSPKVFLIAKPALDKDQLVAWLDYVGGVSRLESMSGSDAEKLIELGGRICYRSYTPQNNLNLTKVRGTTKEYVQNIINQGHLSVLRHAQVTFVIEDCSRVFTHELIRHTAGCAYSQESLRYVRRTPSFRTRFYLPSVFRGDDEKAVKAREIISSAVLGAFKAADELEQLYDIDHLSFAEKKELTSAIRRILPQGMSTSIMFSCNLQALRHIIEQRTSEHAEEEIRTVFSIIREMVQREFPYIFDKSQGD